MSRLVKCTPMPMLQQPIIYMDCGSPFGYSFGSFWILFWIPFWISFWTPFRCPCRSYLPIHIQGNSISSMDMLVTETCYYSLNQVLRGVMNQDMSLNETSFYSRLYGKIQYLQFWNWLLDPVSNLLIQNIILGY